MEGEGLFQGGHTEVTRHGVGQSPAEHLAAVPVHDRDQVEEALCERDVGNVRAPDLVGPVDEESPQQVGVFEVRLVRNRRSLLGGQRPDSHQVHQPLDALAVDEHPLASEHAHHHP